MLLVVEGGWRGGCRWWRWRGCYGEPRSEQLTPSLETLSCETAKIGETLERRSAGVGVEWRSDTSSSKSNTRKNAFTLMSPSPSSVHSTRNISFVSFASYSLYPLFPFSFSVRPSVFIFYSVVSSPPPPPPLSLTSTPSTPPPSLLCRGPGAPSGVLQLTLV